MSHGSVLTTFQGLQHNVADHLEEVWHEGKRLGYWDIDGWHHLTGLNHIFHGAARLSSETVAGSAQSIPSTYGFGEMWELRFNSAKSNAQFQGIFMNVRTTVANNSTIRGMEVGAEQSGAVAVGVLEGANFFAGTRSTGAGDVGAMYGLTGEIKHNSNAYTGTVAEAAAIRGKFTAEDGATYTASSVFLAQVEPLSGAKTLGSVYRCTGHASITFDALLDMTGVKLTVVDADKVNLIKFRDSGGDEVILRVANDGTVSVAAA